jgi:hypothetical protein
MARSEHGVFVHYLALTFSTLLSSQVSGAHRTEFLCSAWGNDPRYEVWEVQVKCIILAQTSCPPTGVGGLPSVSMRLRTTVRTHLSRNLVGQWDPPGRPRQINRSEASRTPLRPHIPYACVTERSNYSPASAVMPQTPEVVAQLGLHVFPD